MTLGAYELAYRRSIEDPEGFWIQAAQAVEWINPPSVASDRNQGPHQRWFPDGTLNTAHNALDRHVERGHGGDLALIHESPVTSSARALTFAELLDQVADLAGALRELGVAKGDRVLLYMPMVPEAVVGMLACARLGAVHVVVFGGFAPAELAARIDHARPKVILSASCGIEGTRVVAYKPLLDSALARAEHRPEACLILQRPQELASMTARDYDWREAVARATPAACVEVAATDPLYILYTSGTTGRPKGVVRDNGGHAVALAWSMRHIYNCGAGDVFWAASDIGWVVGHSYIVYGPLLVGATSVLYEGKPVGTPDAAAFWRVVQRHRVNVLFTAPTALRAIKKADPEAEGVRRHDLSSLGALFLAGERTDPATYAWATDALAVPIVDNWWQTETGWPIAANCLGLERLPAKPGSPTRPVPGYRLRVVDDDGRPVAAGEHGEIALELPLPPGCLTTLWDADDHYLETYMARFPGCYASGDAGYFDDDGYVYVMGRLDDVINVAGHRLSTGAIEQVVSAHDAVAECAVIGVPDDLKGQLPDVFVVLKDDRVEEGVRIADELRTSVRAEIGAIASLRAVHVVGQLPKTRSGKVLRRTMRQLAAGEPVDVPATIDDPSALDGIAAAIADG